MNRFLVSFLLLLITVLPAACDDQAKAKGLLDKATAMASDPAGKRAVSLAAAEILSVPRSELVRWRKDLNLNYGDVFAAYCLAKTGVKIEGMASQIRNGQTVWQIAEQMHANWKEVTSQAKKLNNKVDGNLLKHFANRNGEAASDQAEGYDPFVDSVKADGNVSRKEIDEAQKRYLFLRDHVPFASASKLDTSTEGSARMVRTDPIRTGGPSNPDTNTVPTSH